MFGKITPCHSPSSFPLCIQIHIYLFYEVKIYLTEFLLLQNVCNWEDKGTEYFFPVTHNFHREKHVHLHTAIEGRGRTGARHGVPEGLVWAVAACTGLIFIISLSLLFQLLWPVWWHSPEEQWQLQCFPGSELPQSCLWIWCFVPWGCADLPDGGTESWSCACLSCLFWVGLRPESGADCALYLLEGGLSFACVKGIFACIEIRPGQSMLDLPSWDCVAVTGQENPRSLPNGPLQRLMRFVGSLNPNRICALYKSKMGRVANRESWKCSKFAATPRTTHLGLETMLMVEQDQAPESLGESTIITSTYSSYCLLMEWHLYLEAFS